MTEAAVQYWHTPPYTADEVLGWPDDNIPHEVIEGALVVAAAHANLNHQLVLENLRQLVWPALPADLRLIGPVNLRINNHNLFVPDLVVAKRRRTSTDQLALAPEEVRLVVEVTSPSNRLFDMNLKPDVYAQAGIEHLWLIDIVTADGPVLYAHRLDLDVGQYARRSWRAGYRAELFEPFEVSFDPAGLVDGG